MKKSERDEIVAELLKQFPIYDLVSFNEFDVQDKCAKNSDLYVQYYELYLSEKQELAHLEELKIRLVGQIYDELRFPEPNSKNPNACKNLDKKEIIEYYIPRDERYIRLLEIIEKQRVRVEFFEVCAKAIDKMSWNIKDFKDFLKMPR
jgi:hypothetical protein